MNAVRFNLFWLEMTSTARSVDFGPLHVTLNLALMPFVKSS